MQCANRIGLQRQLTLYGTRELCVLYWRVQYMIYYFKTELNSTTVGVQYCNSKASLINTDIFP